MGLRIQEWAKTADGLEILEQQVLFVMQGTLWQGWGGKGCVYVHEGQATDEEIRDAIDVDGTKQKVWQERKSRLEGRNDRKMKEYDARRHELRKQRSEIVTAIQQQKSVGIEPSPDDLYQITRIDERMARLRDLIQEQELAVASLEEGHAEAILDSKPHYEDEPTRDVRAKCDICGEIQPANSETAAYRWVLGHKMGRHKEAYKKQKALERAQRKAEKEAVQA